MQIALSAVITFVIAQQIFGYFYYQLRLESSAFTTFYPEPASVPLILLTFGQAIHLLGLWFVSVYLHHTSAKVAVFPRLWVTEKQDSSELDLFWQKVSAYAVCFLPLVGFIWVWWVFPEGSAWIKADLGREVALFRPLAECGLFIDWDTCRYGDLNAARALDDEKNGSSFVPFWHPLIAGTLSATILGLSVRFFLRFRQRLIVHSN